MDNVGDLQYRTTLAMHHISWACCSDQSYATLLPCDLYKTNQIGSSGTTFARPQ
jgi:hypothetical protein